MNHSVKSARYVRKAPQAVLILLLLTSVALPAQNQASRVRNVVLVHGAWADGSG